MRPNLRRQNATISSPHSGLFSHFRAAVTGLSPLVRSRKCAQPFSPRPSLHSTYGQRKVHFDPKIITHEIPRMDKELKALLYYSQKEYSTFQTLDKMEKMIHAYTASKRTSSSLNLPPLSPPPPPPLELEYSDDESLDGASLCSETSLNFNMSGENSISVGCLSS
jgi:hypothetical protein